jgi:hypothetical protein
VTSTQAVPLSQGAIEENKKVTAASCDRARTENNERNKENLNIILENSGMLNEDDIIDLSRVQESLGEMGNQLDKLLKG